MLACDWFMASLIASVVPTRIRHGPCYFAGDALACGRFTGYKWSKHTPTVGVVVLHTYGNDYSRKAITHGVSVLHYG